MIKLKTVLAIFLAIVLMTGVFAACTSEANVASHNVSQAADHFEVMRRIVFYNGITGEYMLTIEGLCSLGNFDKDKELSVTCKTGPNEYTKDFLGLSDNVTYFLQQMKPIKANPYHYRVVFKPSTLLPDIDVQ